MAYLVIISRRYEYYWILFPFYSKSTIPRSMSSLLKKKVFFTNWISLIQLWLISENTPVKSTEYQLKPIWMSKVCISLKFHSKFVEKIKQTYLCTEILMYVYYILLSKNIIDNIHSYIKFIQRHENSYQDVQMFQKSCICDNVTRCNKKPYCLGPLMYSQNCLACLLAFDTNF